MHNVLSMFETRACDCKSDKDADNGNPLSLLEELRREVAQGFLDSHARTNKNAAKALEIASFCYALIELLEEKGLITFEELNNRQKVVNKRLVKKFADQGMGVGDRWCN